MSHPASSTSSAILTADTVPAAQATITAPEDTATDVPRDKQAAFVCTLAQWGNVQAAARQVGVSRAHLYRMRRASAQFRNLWDAALVLARPQVEEVLADRALNGVQETVFYHGEEVATRTRYDSRLLLAHLARLDRIAATSGVIATVRDFDAELERLLDPPVLCDWDDEDEDREDEAGDAYDDEGAYGDDGYEDEAADYEGDDEVGDDGAHDHEASEHAAPEVDGPEGPDTPATSGDTVRQPDEDPADAHRRAQAACIAAFSGAGSGAFRRAGSRAGFDPLDSVSCVSNSPA